MLRKQWQRKEKHVAFLKRHDTYEIKNNSEGWTEALARSVVDACKRLPVLLRQSDGAATALADVKETLETAAHEEGLHYEYC